MDELKNIKNGKIAQRVLLRAVHSSQVFGVAPYKALVESVCRECKNGEIFEGRIIFNERERVIIVNLQPKVSSEDINICVDLSAIII